MTNVAYRLARPFLHLLDPETAHHITVWALRNGLAGSDTALYDPILSTRAWNIDFSNPLGLAAGFDKDAVAADQIIALGFGFVEVGTVTPRPQPGNPRPRLFRLDEDRAVINRFGFNSKGLAAFVTQLSRLQRGASRGVLGANVGKNRDTVDAAADYAQGIEAVCGLADYLVCNVSSPNTPGLRNLQARDQMEELIARVLEARERGAAVSGHRPPLLVKVGPDLRSDEVRDIGEVALARKIDGLIIGNTTIDRPQDLRSRHAGETGGLSGRPLLRKANACLAEMYACVGGRLPIIGCGGVASGADAYAKIRAGASLVQMYSALIFDGPVVVGRIKRELAGLLRADGFTSVAAAVGIDTR